MLEKNKRRVHYGLGQREKYIFVLPGMIWILFFTVFPLIYSLGISFYAGRFGKLDRFIGLQNYVKLFQDYRFWSALRVTVIFVGVSVTVIVVLGMILALILNRKMKSVRIFRMLFTMPLFTAPIALGYLGLMIFYEEHGPINSIVQALGFSKIPWLSNPVWAMVAVAIVNIWQWVPFAFIVLMAGLQSVPEEVYESARLDTSSALDIFRYITLPLIAPILFTVIILCTVESFKMFDIAFSLTDGGPGIATQTLTYYTYTTGMRNQNFGYASALSFILLAIVLTISTLFFRRYRDIYD